MATTISRAGQGDAKFFKAAMALVRLRRAATGTDGKRRRKKVSAKAHGEVILKRDAVRTQLAKGQSPADDRMTVARPSSIALDSRRRSAGHHQELPDHGEPAHHSHGRRPKALSH